MRRCEWCGKVIFERALDAWDAKCEYTLLCSDCLDWMRYKDTGDIVLTRLRLSNKEEEE